jgi:hypothetical protein
MADSKAQREAEVWIREHWLPQLLGQPFEKKKLTLRWGGKFEFDGVSKDGHIAVCISTCGGITSGGKKASPKLNKIRSDALFLLSAEVEKRIVVFSDQLMYDLCEAEKKAGRFPHEVEIRRAPLPTEMEEVLCCARRVAALEVSPIITDPD